MRARLRWASDFLRRWGPWGLLALIAGAAAVAGSYLAVGLTPAFVVTPMDGLVVQYSPAALITWAIETLGDLGHQLAFLTAIAGTVGLLGLASLPGVLALKAGQRALGALLAALLAGMLAVGLTGATSSAAGAAIGAGLVITVAGLIPAGADPAISPGRRGLLGALGTVATLGVLGGLLHPGEQRGATGEVVTAPTDARPEVRHELETAAAKSLPVDGLEPLVSTVFYEVDINNINPVVDAEEWTLSVTGAVEEEVTYDTAALRELPREDRFVTLRCVGDGLNGTKMDNALWTGVPMQHILEPATPQGEFVMLRAADDYYNEFPIEALWPGLLADEMNGRPLPRGHGAPVRALVPGHWGEINVKWIDEIEVLERPAEGYWEKKGWHGTGPVHTVAKLWVQNRLEDGRIEVAGHAYAGTRGIDRVEVSTDGGQTWTEATLSDPLPGDDVWRQWVHRYTAEDRHQIVVRAVDGTGRLQPQEWEGPYPSGATGWVRTTMLP